MKKSKAVAEDEENLIESEVSSKTDTNKCCACLGFFFSISAGVTYTLTSVIAKMLSQIHPLQISLSRFIGCLILGGIICLVKKLHPFPKPERSALIGRAVTGMVGTVVGYYGVQHMAFGDASTISSNVAVLVVILARIFLKEKLPGLTVFAIVLSAFGVVLVAKPTFLARYFGMEVAESHNEVSGVIAAFMALLMYSLEYVCVSQMRTADTGQSLLSFGLIAVPMGVVALLCIDRFRLLYTTWDKFLYILMFFLNMLAETLLILSSKSESASLLALGDSASITVGYLVQVFQFHESITVSDMAGVMLVITAIMIISVQKCYAK